MKSAKIKRAKDACSQCLLDKGLTQCLVILKGSRVPSVLRLPGGFGQTKSQSFPVCDTVATLANLCQSESTLPHIPAPAQHS